MIVRGTCGACRHYRDNLCARAGSSFAGRHLWSLACVPCTGYERSEASLSEIPSEALAAVTRRPATSQVPQNA